MSVVIHAECSRLCVMVLGHIGKYLFIMFFMELTLYSAYSFEFDTGGEQRINPASIFSAKRSLLTSLKSRKINVFGGLSCLILKITQTA